MAGVERVTVTVSYADLPERGALGHRQVTGAYLVALASAHGGVLATMDEALAALYPEWCALI
jgi:predicted nucleic acid-binding protein